MESFKGAVKLETLPFLVSKHYDFSRLTNTFKNFQILSADFRCVSHLEILWQLPF